MTREEIEMSLLIGGWIKQKSETSRADTVYTHVDSALSLGTQENGDKGIVFQNGGYIGTLPLEAAYNKVNDHMILMQELNNGQRAVLT